MGSLAEPTICLSSLSSPPKPLPPWGPSGAPHHEHRWGALFVWPRTAGLTLFNSSSVNHHHWSARSSLQTFHRPPITLKGKSEVVLECQLPEGRDGGVTCRISSTDSRAGLWWAPASPRPPDLWSCSLSLDPPPHWPTFSPLLTPRSSCLMCSFVLAVPSFWNVPPWYADGSFLPLVRTLPKHHTLCELLPDKGI